MNIRGLFRGLSGWMKEAPEVSAADSVQPGGLKKALKFILVDDCKAVMDCLEIYLRQGFADARILKFEDGEQAWAEVVREEPDYLISDLTRCGVDGCELLRRLAQRRVKFPILIVSGSLPTRERQARQCAGRELNVSFAGKPFTLAELLAIVKAGLGITMDDPPVVPALRIIHVDDEPVILEMISIIVRQRLKNIELIQFQNSKTALNVLVRNQPDVLITDDAMPGLSGSAIVRQLAERRVSYPIIVISALPATREWVDHYARQGMRISLLVSPFDMYTFFRHLEQHLDPL